MRYTILIIFILVIGCAAKNTNESLKDDEVFEDFFKEFSSNPTFQSSRINFPLKHSYYDGESLIDDEISGNDWEYIDFGQDSLASARKEDAYSIELKSNQNSVEYLRKGIDNGISMSYYFEKRKAQWFLVKILDRSN